MRIHRSLVFHIGTVSRRAMVLAGSSVLVVTSLVTTAFILQRPQTSYAATPPDTCFAFTAGAGTITDYYDYEDNNAANPACPRAVDIPSSIGGVTVTTIGTGAFASNQLAAVIIPNSVTSLGTAAFNDNQLTTITIPGSVTSIGDAAFYNNQLASATISSGVITIGYSAFQNNLLTDIVIPSTVTTILNDTFQGNPVVNVTIPDSVTSLGFAFDSASISGTLSINMVDIPQSVFYGRLKPGASLILGSSVRTIGDHAFYGDYITQLTIPNSVTSIGFSAFSGNNLTSVTIPGSVATVGGYAFDSNQLESATLENGLITIGNGTFRNNHLTSLTIPNSVTTIGDSAFADNSLTTVTIHGNPTISGGAFANNGLNKSTIPSSVVRYSTEYYDYYQSNASFVRLYATNPAFLAAHTDTLYTDTINSTTYTTSGYLINPASVTVRTVDTSGTDLQPSTLHVSDTYPDYLISSNPGVIASPSTPIASTAYYRVGNTESFTAPHLTGYILTSSATNNPTLVAGDNTVTFTYTPPVHTVPFATNAVVDYIATTTTPASSLSSSLITSSSLSIPSASNPCSAISSASLLPVTGALSSAAPANVTLLGGVNFTLHCTSAAATTVTYTLGGTTDISALRVYKSNGTTLTDITSDVTITTANGLPVISYTLQDGGDYDEDGVANGKIVDPLYVGIKSAPTSRGILAETGEDVWVVVCVGLILFGGGVAGTLKRFLRA